MDRFVRISIVVVLLAGSIAVFGCSRTVVHKGRSSKTETAEADKPGPPPHAPAHGYRHKHSNGVVLVYESSIGVYVVSGYRDVYFYKNSYYRMHKNRWQASHRVDGPWRQSSDKKVPPGLRQQAAEAKLGDDKSEGKSNDKGNDKGNNKDNNKNDDKGKGKDKDKDKDKENNE